MTAKKQKKASDGFDFRSIRSFEDACKKEGISETLPDLTGIQDEFRKPILAVYKLMVIFKAINNGWIPDWDNSNQYKYYPWFRVLSSGFGFSASDYYPGTDTGVGSRLCTNTSDKALYIARQFNAEYENYFLYKK